MAEISDNLTLSDVAALNELDDQIEALQGAKRDLFAERREEHGKRYANALKNAVKLSRMDSEKRAELDEMDAETFRILSLIEGHRAPRATRARDFIEEFDADTGEILDHEPQPASQVAQTEPVPFQVPNLVAQHETVESSATHLPETKHEASGIPSIEGVKAPIVTVAADANAGGENEVSASAHTAAGEGATKALAANSFRRPGETWMERTPHDPAVWHDFSRCFPERWGMPLAELADDIREIGLRRPIVRIGAEILDGRARYNAARDLGIEYPVTEYDGTDPLADVIRWNLRDRDMSTGERKAVAAKLAKLPEVAHRAAEIFELFGLEAEVTA